MDFQEKEKLLNELTERILLRLPEVIGNLITNHISLMKLNEDFYKAHPELSKHKRLVASIVEKFEGFDPTADYKEVFEKALPEIKAAIKATSNLDVTKVEKPNRKLSMDISGNGEL